MNRVKSFQNHSRTAVASIKATKGSAPFATSSIFAFPTACIINRFNPTGGVIRAVSIKITKKIPNQMGSIDITSRAGNKTGTIISSMLRASRKNPMIKSVLPTASINKPGSDILLVRNWLMDCGIR